MSTAVVGSEISVTQLGRWFGPRLGRWFGPRLSVARSVTQVDRTWPVRRSSLR